MMAKLFWNNFVDIIWTSFKFAVIIGFFVCLTLIEMEWLLNYFPLFASAVISVVTNLCLLAALIAWRFAKIDMELSEWNEKE